MGLSLLDGAGQIQSICPLQRTDVRSDISGQIARVVVTQLFSDPATAPIEALYTFPLPHDAAVDGMTFRVGERTISGEIKISWSSSTPMSPRVSRRPSRRRPTMWRARWRIWRP